MKRIFKIASVLAAVIAIASCAEIDDPILDNAEARSVKSDILVNTEIVATFLSTKVNYAEEGTNLRPSWEKGDKVIALGEDGADYKLTVKTVNEDKSAILGGQVPANSQLHLIYCPGMTASELTVDYTSQTGAQNTMPAVMLSDGEVKDGKGVFKFRNAGAIICISAVKGVPSGSTISKITVEGKNLSAATIVLSGSALTLTATEKPIDAISVEGLNLTVEDANGTLSSPVFLAVPAGAMIAKVSVPLAKEAETMRMPSATPQEGVDYVTIAGIKWAKWNIGASESSEHPETDYGWYFYWGGTEGYYRYADTWQSVTSTSFEFAYSPSTAYEVVASDYVYVKTQTFAITGHRFTWANTPYHTGSDSRTGWTKYIPEGFPSYWSGEGGSPDNKLTLDPEDDAARVNWGGNWRMPKKDEIASLTDKTKTTSKWIDNYEGTGINGCLFTSNVEGEEGHSIFFPATGYGGSNNSLNFSGSGSIGNYWSNSVYPLSSTYNPSYAYGLFTSTSEGVKTDASQRYHGFPVRPVSND